MKTPKISRWAALCAALLLSSIGLSASPSRVLVSLEMSDPQSLERYRDFLETALAAAPASLTLFRGKEGIESARDEAARRSCDLSLSVRLESRSGLDSVEWRYEDPAGSVAALASGAFEKPGARNGDLASYFWTEIAEALPRAIAALPARMITVAGEPGAIVEGFGEPFEIPSSGELEIVMSLPAVVEWRASSRGSLVESGSVLVSSPGTRLEIPHRRLQSWGVDLDLYDLRFLEASLSLALGRRFFARASAAEFFAGLALEDYSGPPPKPSLLEHSASIRLGLGAGYYFMAPEKAFRAYAVADAFVLLESRPYLGIAATSGAEWRPSPRGGLFFELGADLAPFSPRAFAFPRTRLGWRLLF